MTILFLVLLILLIASVDGIAAGILAFLQFWGLIALVVLSLIVPFIIQVTCLFWATVVLYASIEAIPHMPRGYALSLAIEGLVALFLWTPISASVRYIFSGRIYKTAFSLRDAAIEAMPE